jgi:hypothetical protein
MDSNFPSVSRRASKYQNEEVAKYMRLSTVAVLFVVFGASGVAIGY